MTANDAVVRVARFEGEFPWHEHDEDEPTRRSRIIDTANRLLHVAICSFAMLVSHAKR